jgi:hypothetical protein
VDRIFDLKDPLLFARLRREEDVMQWRHLDRKVRPPEPEEPTFDYGPGYTLDQGRAGFYGRYWNNHAEESAPSPTTYRLRGRFTGCGLKTYVRPDERIYDDINEELTLHSEIDATEIEVCVNDGEVVLTGFVENRRMKRLAEDVAEGVYGVKGVLNNLRISRSRAA